MGSSSLNTRIRDEAAGRTKRVVLYLRVSSKRQMDTDSDVDPDGNSINTQDKWCRAFARKLGAVVVKVFIEPGNSAQTIEKRPEFRKMLAFLHEDGDIDAVIYYNRARVFRNYIDAGNTKQQLATIGVDLLSARENFGEGLTGEVMEALTDVFNWWMVRQSGEDIKAKMANKARNGGTIGKAPIGYLNVRKRVDGREIRTVALDPERSHYIPMAFELMATGRETLESLQGKLTDAGLRMQRSGNGISIEGLRKLLRDRYYIGFVEHDGIEYPGRHTALVEVELFDRVQRILDANGENHVRHRTHHHYLKGLLWCGRCEHRFVLTRAEGRHGGVYFYFFCRGRQDGVCDMPYVPVEVMEDGVERYYASSVTLSDDFRAEVALAVDEALTGDSALSDSLRAEYTKRLGVLDRKEDYYLDLAAEEGWPKDKLRAKLDDIRDEVRSITASLERADEQITTGREVIAAALSLLDDPGRLYKRSGETVRAILNRALFSRLYVDGDKIARAAAREPFAALMGQHQSYHAVRAAEGRTSTTTNKAALLSPPLAGQGWSRTAMVDLVRSYSNRLDLLEVLVSATTNLGQARAAEAVGIPQRVSVRSDAPPETAWRLSDRLDDAAIAELVRAFHEDGTSKRALAERHGISESSVKRILRKHRSATTA